MFVKPERPRSVVQSFTTPDTRGVLYTCPPNCRSKMVLLFIANANGNVNVSIEWYRASADTHYFILGAKSFTQSDFLQFTDSYIVLEPGDKIEVTLTNNANPEVDVFCTVEEMFIPVG